MPQKSHLFGKSFKNGEVLEGFGKYYRTVFDFDYREPCSSFDRNIRDKITNALKTCNGKNNLREISEDEILIARKELKRRKAPGPDEITNEHIIHGGKPIIMAIKLLFNRVIEQEKCPDAWKQLYHSNF